MAYVSHFDRLHALYGEVKRIALSAPSYDLRLSDKLRALELMKTMIKKLSIDVEENGHTQGFDDAQIRKERGEILEELEKLSGSGMNFSYAEKNRIYKIYAGMLSPRKKRAPQPVPQNAGYQPRLEAEAQDFPYPEQGGFPYPEEADFPDIDL